MLQKLPNIKQFINLHKVLGQKGYQYGIENHCSLFIDKHPVTGERALITAKYGKDWSYVDEDDLFSVDVGTKQVIEQDIDTQYKESFLLNMLSIHIGTSMKRSDIKCIIHTHPLSLCTLIALNEPYNKILNVNVNNLRFNSINKIGYDSEYTEFLEVNEYEKYSQLIGVDNDILLLSNHGVVITADCVETAWDRLYFLDLAAQLQTNIYNTQKDIKYVSESVVDQLSKEWSKESEKQSAMYHFEAVARELNK